MNMAAVYTGHSSESVLKVYREIQRLPLTETHAEQIEAIKAHVDVLVTQASQCIDPVVGDKLLALAHNRVLEIERLIEENDRVQYFGSSCI